MQLANMNIGNGHLLFVVAGTCVIESESMIMNTAQTLKKVREEPGIGLIFKNSFDKTNRSSIDSDRGFGVHGLFVGRESVKYESDGLHEWLLALMNQLLMQLQAIDATVKVSPRPEDLVN